MSSEQKSEERGFIKRGDSNKGSNTLESATFLIARLIDPVVQYNILRYGLGTAVIRFLGSDALLQGPPLLTRTLLDRIGLSPYRTILFAMSVGGVAKQCYHKVEIAQERMDSKTALLVGCLNLAGDSLNSLLFLSKATSASLNGQMFPQTPLIVGSALYAIGLLTEWLSEQQRHNWKRDPRNKGKLYHGGLFGISRHVNYLGYVLWRTGHALACGGWIWGAFNTVLPIYQLAREIIPLHERYLQEKVRFPHRF